MATDERYTLHNQDSKVWLEGVEADSVSLVLTDPPYGTTQHDYEQGWLWDEATFALWWNHMARITTPNAWVVMFGAQPFTSDLIVSNKKGFVCEDIWVKSRKSNPLNTGYRPLGQHENILIFNMGQPRRATYNPQYEAADTQRSSRGVASAGAAWDSDYEMHPWQDNGFRHPTSVHYCPNPKRVKGAHPSAKPVALLERLIATYTNEGDTVLDSFMGEGNTGCAAVGTNRRFVGNELIEKWHARAVMKLEQTYAAVGLFN